MQRLNPDTQKAIQEEMNQFIALIEGWEMVNYRGSENPQPTNAATEEETNNLPERGERDPESFDDKVRSFFQKDL